MPPVRVGFVLNAERLRKHRGLWSTTGFGLRGVDNSKALCAMLLGVESPKPAPGISVG